MRYYIDTEFNGAGGQLLSLALVRQDGECFYEVLEAHEPVDPWVRDNVAPHFGQPPVTREHAFATLQHFLQADAGPHVFIADWPVDLIHLNAMLLKGSFRRGEPRRYCCLALNLDGFETALSSRQPHNALEDARAIAAYVEGNLSGDIDDMDAADLALVRNACGQTGLA